MDGTSRAAVLLLGVGEEKAAEVLKHLEPKQVQSIGIAMTKLANVDKTQIEKVVEDFLSVTEQHTSLGVDSEQYVRDMLVTALGEERSGAFIDRILSDNEHGGLNTLKWLDAETVSDIIRGEHPQTIATILTYLESEQAAEVVATFPEEKRIDILLRMSALGSVKPEALNELGKIVEAQLSVHSGGKAASIGGVKSVADLVNFLDSAIETQVLDGIGGVDNELSEQIKENMFVFDNIVDMDGRSVQTLLRDISSETLMIALKGADDRVKEKVFTNMSKRAAELMRDDLEAQAPVKISEVEAAQKEVLASARKLADAGEISLGAKGGEEMV